MVTLKRSNKNLFDYTYRPIYCFIIIIFNRNLDVKKYKAHTLYNSLYLNICMQSDGLFIFFAAYINKAYIMYR
jgi:hypothetical protein